MLTVELVATVSEFLTGSICHACILDSKRRGPRRKCFFCKEEPAVRDALTAATNKERRVADSHIISALTGDAPNPISRATSMVGNRKNQQSVMLNGIEE